MTGPSLHEQLTGVKPHDLRDHHAQFGAAGFEARLAAQTEAHGPEAVAYLAAVALLLASFPGSAIVYSNYH